MDVHPLRVLQNKTREGGETIMIDYEIISTGSKGNCVVIDDIMVDCGVPFKKMKDYLYDVSVLLLTHIHSDHIKESTLKNIVVMFPHIEIYGNYEVAQVFSEYPIKVINTGVPFTTRNGILIEAFECIHDVVCYGYMFNTSGLDVIYATDTSDLRHAPDRKFDYFFIESNHDEKKLVQLANARSFGYNVIAGAQRHMSTQTAKTFYYMHRKGKDAKFIELHMSSRFY
jgi:L-ascorbate metabolism protein UlaG (beta-lactamase superfamily)